METKHMKAISAQMEALKLAYDNAVLNRKKAYKRITGLQVEQIRIINENFVVFECKSLEDVRNVMNKIKASKNGWKMDHSQVHHITTLYRYDIENSARENHKLKIQFENATGLHYRISIDIHDLPDGIVDEFFYNVTRPVYSSETHYFEGFSRTELSKMKIRAKDFINKSLGWYGGDRTLICEGTCEKLTNMLKGLDED